MIEVVTMGEMLIDFVSVKSGVAIKDSPGFTKAPGGAPANVAVGVKRLGHTSGFIGKVGSDDFGRFLVETLAQEGVDTHGVRYEDRARTMLAFVSLGPDGEREFMFYRHPSADMLLEPGEIDTGLIASARVFHHGSISLITEPSRSATLAAVEAARAAGALVSYDPNLRLPLWPAPDEARSAILAAAPSADIIKVSEEELAFLTGATGVREGVRKLRDIVPGDCAIVVTCGRRGCALALGGSAGPCLEIPGFDVRAVDTTGAGDGFVAGLLVGMIRAMEGRVGTAGANGVDGALNGAAGDTRAGTARRGAPALSGDSTASGATGGASVAARAMTAAGARTAGKLEGFETGEAPDASADRNLGLRTVTPATSKPPSLTWALRHLDETDWRRVLTFANAVGALCTTKLGAIPALPTAEEVRAFLEAQGLPSASVYAAQVGGLI